MTQGDIIYVNGDSFTAGSDLGDYLLPDYPSEKSLNDFLNNLDGESAMNYENWRHKWYSDRPDLLDDVKSSEINLRWSTHLSTLLDTEIVNNSYPGSDNYGIVVRACNDIEKLNKQGYRISRIIIQFTGFSRYSYLRHVDTSAGEQFQLDIKNISKLELGDGFYLRHLMPIQRDTTRLTKRENRFVEREILEEMVYEDQCSSTKFLSNLLTLKMYSDAIKGVSGIKPLFVDSIFMKSYFAYTGANRYLKPDSYINEIFNYIFPEPMLSMYDIPEFNEPSLTGGGHFVSSVHKQFAEQIAMRYFNE